ncbi:tetratricopeptide repeat-containing sensor histidine kinase [Mucilaginibacter pedocola]|nr:histidine kinase dimerization/phosphoacceptor domain -containing protein [Mucilaginibacter pedocola]
MINLKAWAILIVLAAPCLCFGQTLPGPKTIDSLRRICEGAREDTACLNALGQMGRYYLLRRFKADSADVDTAGLYFNKQLALGQKMGAAGRIGRAEAWCNLGEVTFARKSFAGGKVYFMQAVNYYNTTGNKIMAGRMLLRFGKTAAENKWGLFPDALLADVTEAYNKALALFAAAGAVGDQVVAYTNFAMLHFTYGQYAQAEEDCMAAIKKFPTEGHPEFVKLYYVLAHIQRYHGNLNKALRYSLESLRLMEQATLMPDKLYLKSMLFGEIALIYDAMGQTENSIVWYKRTLALREGMHIKLEFKYRTAGFIAQGLIKQKKVKEAISIVLGVEKRHPTDNDYNKAIMSQIKAYCYDAVGNNAKAEEMYLLALKLFGKQKTDEIISLAKYDMAKFYIKRNDFKKAAFYFDEGIIAGMAVTRSRDWNMIAYKIDSARGNYLTALQHHIQYKAFNDSIFNIEKNKQLQELQVSYETDQKESDIRSLKKDSAFEHEKTIQANNMRNLTLAACALLVILLMLIFNNYKAKQRSNVVLNALVAEKDELLIEKEWLIKEIHHRVKNNLQIVMGLLQRQSAYIDNEAALQAIQISEARMHSIALIHQKLYQSESLGLISMPDYIEEMARYLKESSDLGSRILFEKHVDEISLDVGQAVPLGLILNEAVTNAIKYAYTPYENGVIYITLVENEAGHNQLIIADDGPGLPEGFKTEKVETLGINLMRGLAKQLCGTFEITSDQGCTICVTFKTEIFNKGKA